MISNKAFGGLVLITAALLMIAAVLSDDLVAIGIALILSLQGKKLREEK